MQCLVFLLGSQVELRDGDGTQLALKVLINTASGERSTQIREGQMAEYALLKDSVRLPPHPNILPVLHSFVDRATTRALPGWDFDSDIVCSRTSFTLGCHEGCLARSLGNCGDSTQITILGLYNSIKHV